MARRTPLTPDAELDTPEPADVDTGALPAPIQGTDVDDPGGDLVTINPTIAEQNTAAERARGRTTIQAGLPTILVGIAVYLLRLWNVDLDPGAGKDIPADVAGYFVGLATIGIAWRMNPKRK